MKDRKSVPIEERFVIASYIRDLLALRDATGRKVWTQQSLGVALNGLSQESIRRALDPTGVTPAVRDGVLKHTGLSMKSITEMQLKAAQDYYQRNTDQHVYKVCLLYTSDAADD